MPIISPIINFFRLCLFTEVQGVVTMHGKPVAGAEVIQKYNWKDEIISTCTTDEFGKFNFPNRFAYGLLKLLPFETVISQEITIKSNGLEYIAWQTMKRNFRVMGELDKNQQSKHQKLQLVCELTENSQARRRAGNNNQGIYGCARWPDLNIPDNEIM